jgi:transcriptional regulator with XRE-family HTH domain
MDTEQAVIDLDVHKAAKDIIGTIDKEREREIISRRFGLYDRKETLEQIGELLGITRERVRQLEKATLTKMKATASDLPHMAKIEEVFTAELEKLGRVAPVKVLAKGVMDQPKREDNSHIAFLSELAPNLKSPRRK